MDALTIPPVLRGKRILSLEMREFRQKVHRDLPPTLLWGFDGRWPGPTIEAEAHSAIDVTWSNRLPKKHLLPIDTTIHGAESKLPMVRTITHLHGAQVMPEDDGYPDAWTGAGGEHGPLFNPKPVRYPNEQLAATLWYHDHCIGITRLNVYAGLAGFYLLRDPVERALGLPEGEYDIPLMIQDRFFESDGSLLYPQPVDGPHPIWIQELFGDVICVNGVATPFFEVEPRQYRFRLLNASNARFYRLRLFHTDNAGMVLEKGFQIPETHQIGSDSGLLAAPLSLRFLLIAPGERLDVIVDFSAFAGQSFAWRNDAAAPYTMGGGIVPTEVMLFRVRSQSKTTVSASPIPTKLIPFQALDPKQAVRERRLLLSEKERASDGAVEMSLLGNARWHDPITEVVKAGTIEIWTFVNVTADVHPIHLHLVRFQVLNRQPFDVKNYLTTGEIVFFGPPQLPEEGERMAWKDTVKATPGYVTRIIQRFDLPAAASKTPGQEFLYVWHCHILEHEDNEMMRPYKVVT